MHKTSFAGVASTFLLCFLFWILLTWSADVQELATGAVISLAVALFSSRFFIHEKPLWFFNPYSPTCRGYFPSEVGQFAVRIGNHCFYNPTQVYAQT